MGKAANEMGDLVAQILEKYQQLHLELSKVAAPALIPSFQDMRRHLSRLVYDGFITRTPPQSLAHLPRYLDALASRLRKLLNAGLSRDVDAMLQVEPLQERYDQRRAEHERAGIVDPELELYRLMLEELRVSLFAQELKTSMPVSVKRLEAQWAKVKK
jgi:ATP-dependent helicase HrpA